MRGLTPHETAVAVEKLAGCKGDPERARGRRRVSIQTGTCDFAPASESILKLAVFQLHRTQALNDLRPEFSGVSEVNER